MLPGIVGYFCVIPFALAILVYIKQPAKRNTLLLVAIFWSTDNAVFEYGGTPSVVRYLIYVAMFAVLLHRSTIDIRRFSLMMFLAIFYLSITMVFHQNLNTSQLIRDVQILILVFALICFKSRSKFDLDLSFFFIVMTSYLVAENINFFALKSIWQGDYMSYDTTKYLIIFPSIFALFNRSPKTAFVLVALTLPVLVGYTSRNLILVYLCSVILILLTSTITQGIPKRLISGIGVIVLYSVFIRYDFTNYFEGYKSLNMTLILKNHGISAIQLLDPVRYVESQLFFQQPLYQVLFGRGFGSGIEDISGKMGFVTVYQSAFSADELNSNVYYNFHDVWVDVGLRFGLLPLAFFLVWAFRLRLGLDRGNFSIWVMSVIGFSVAFYSTAGLITAVFMAKVALECKRAPKRDFDVW